MWFLSVGINSKGKPQKLEKLRTKIPYKIEQVNEDTQRTIDAHFQKRLKIVFVNSQHLRDVIFRTLV